MLYLLRWLYGEDLLGKKKSSWLPLANPAQRVKLICGDAQWVIALTTRPLVLLTGLVWSFIYTPFCSGFQDNFPSSLESTNYKAWPTSLGGMLNTEKDLWFGCLLQKHNRFSHFGLRVGLVRRLIWALQLGRDRCADVWFARSEHTDKPANRMSIRRDCRHKEKDHFIVKVEDKPSWLQSRLHIHSSGCLHGRNRAST